MTQDLTVNYPAQALKSARFEISPLLKLEYSSSCNLHTNLLYIVTASLFRFQKVRSPKIEVTLAILKPPAVKSFFALLQRNLHPLGRLRSYPIHQPKRVPHQQSTSFFGFRHGTGSTEPALANGHPRYLEQLSFKFDGGK